MSRPRIAVVGGGVAGLAAAHRVLELSPLADVTVLEASERSGGLLATERIDDWVIERGPDAIITDKPWALALVKELGLDGELVSTVPENRGAYVVAHGRLERIPDGFSLVAPMELLPFLETKILSTRGKLRAALDLVLPRGGDREESLSQFVRRRLGDEVADRLAQPLVSGIYGAPADQLGLEATMPRFVEMEREARSVILALRRRRAASASEDASGARYGLFVSFRRGNATLVEALASALSTRVRTGARVERIARAGQAHRIELAHGEPITADAVILALPSHVSASLLEPLDPALARLLRAIDRGSSATVTFGFERDQIAHPLDAYGFVVPVIEQRAVLAATFASRKWPHRAPPGKELVRVFLGGAGRPDAVTWSDDELVRAATRELRHLIGLRGAPLLTRIDRYRDAMPHYHVGHRALVASIDRALAAHPGLALAGNSYRGVGIPDTIRSAHEAAAAIFPQK